MIRHEAQRFLDAFLQVRQIIQAANFNRFQRAGLSATQFMTLNLVPEDGLTLSELARKLNLSPPSVKQTVDSLVERKLLVRRPRRNDARKIDLFSTQAGRRFQNAASREFHKSVASLFEALSQEERDGLVGGLERLVAAAAPPGTPALSVRGGRPVKRSAPRSRSR